MHFNSFRKTDNCREGTNKNKVSTFFAIENIYFDKSLQKEKKTHQQIAVSKQR